MLKIKNMKNMKVSIVIPCFNEEKRIEKTVAAALAQDYKNFEIILVNNASTDHTGMILADLHQKHPSKIVVVSEPRQGVLMAREAGRALATGDIIAQLDADCIAPHNWISKALPYFEDNKVIAVAGIYDYYDAHWFHRYGMIAFQMLLMGPTNHLVQRFKKRAAFVGGNVFIRADVLKKAGGYSKIQTFYGDEVDTASRIVPYGKIVANPWLSVKSSARRYHAMGFWKTQSKYDKSSWSAIKRDIIRQSEDTHPR
jgi:glycosyltransferase involved in cell wall biosynthesis